MILQTQNGAAQAGGMEAAMPRFQLDYKSFSDLHRLVRLKSLPLDGNSRFASRLALYLPKAAARIDEDDFGILHLEVGALKLDTRAAILRHDWTTVNEHFVFVTGMLETAGDELRDALHISYLGMLLYGETSSSFVKARGLLPKPLMIALEKIELRYQDLAH